MSEQEKINFISAVHRESRELLDEQFIEEYMFRFNIEEEYKEELIDILNDILL